jgi:DNA anti-recombination protein RmuC
VARFGQAWAALTPRLGEARTILDRARTLADSLDESEAAEAAEPAEFAQAATRLSELSASVATDPLRVDPEELDRLIDSLRAIERDLEAAAALRRDLDARLDDSRAQLARLHALANECRVAHDELRLKISVPTAPAAPELPDDVDRELDQVARLAHSGAWRDARRRLDSWSARTNTMRTQAEDILQLNRAPLEARNQLRALLEAYQIKAGRLGAIEDPQLEQTFAEAHEALHTAPTDLAVAAQLVRRYQELLNDPRPRPRPADEEVLT